MAAWFPCSQLTEQSAECDGWREAGEEEEDEGGHALGVEPVADVTDVMGVSALDVVDHASEGFAGSLHWIAVRVDVQLLNRTLTARNSLLVHVSYGFQQKCLQINVVHLECLQMTHMLLGVIANF